MPEMTPDEAIDKLHDAFARANTSGYRILQTGIGSELADRDNTAYEAATSIVEHHHPNRRYDYREVTKAHRIEITLQRATERQR
jgi:hypothetical protein